MTLDYRVSTCEIESVLLYNELKKREEKYLKRKSFIKFLKKLFRRKR